VRCFPEAKSETERQKTDNLPKLVKSHWWGLKVVCRWKLALKWSVLGDQLELADLHPAVEVFLVAIGAIGIEWRAGCAVMFGAVSPVVMVGGGLWLGVLDWVMGW
jgi:hypothetical protein